MDLITLEAVALELQKQICGAAVGKIHQPGPCELVFRLWNGRENLRLFLSAAPRANRVHLTESKLPNPPAPARFCQLLRSRLTRLITVGRLPGERILRLGFAGQGGHRYDLVAELLGPKANFVLLDGHGRIVDALHRTEGQGRAIGSGKLYLPPERPGRIDLEKAPPEIPPEEPFGLWCREKLAPMTPLVADDLEAAVGAGLSPTEALEGFRRRWVDRDFSPCTGRWRGNLVLSALVPQWLDLEELRTFESMSAAAEAFYAGEAGQDLFGVGKGELQKVVRKGVKKLEKRLANIEAERDKALQHGRQRELGDLLLANLHLLRKGMAEVTLDDWYADPPGPVTIPLDPAVTPQENAEACFRRHRKGKRGLEHTERRRSETEAELEWLEAMALALDEVEQLKELEALRDELVAGGVLKSAGGGRPKPQAAAAESQVRSARSPGGYVLHWGRNPRSNDHVSRRLTEGEDLWFHAHNRPGCHLVLKCARASGEVPEADVLFAAALAAGYSRGKDDNKVEVMVARGKAVRKPKGARAGLVTVDHFRTVVVRPQRLDEGMADDC